MRFLAINAVLRWASIRSPVCPASSSAWSLGECWRPWIGGGGSGSTCRSASVFGLLAGGVVLLAAFVVIESRVAEPMIELSLFRIRAFTAGNVAGFAAALLGPALTLFSRGAVPVVVGQLLAGVILGRTGTRILDPSKSDLALLYDIGFAMLMFLVGMHVPLHDQRLRSALRRGALAAASSVPLALGAGLLCHTLGGGPTLVYGVVIVSSSAAIALPVIDESGLSGPPVLVAMAWITIADILATVAVPPALAPAPAARSALGALIVAVLVIFVFLVVHRLAPVPLVQRVRHEGKKRGWAIDLRLSVVVLVSLAYVAQK